MAIVVVGTVFADIKGRPFNKLSADGRNPGKVEYVHGGVGRNVAEDLARIGVDAVLVSLADGSGTATDILSHLKKEKVNIDFVSFAENGMGTWLAIFDENGDVVTSISARSDLTPLVQIMDREHEKIFKDADSIIIEMDIDEPVVERTFYYAQKYNKKVYALVSVMSIAKERTEYIKKTECFICNLQEAELLFDTDMSGDDLKRTELILKEKASEMCLKRIIVTMAEKGAVYMDADGSTGYCPAEKVSMIDSTGAGDSFCAASAAALTYGYDMDQACRAGAKTAAAVISTTQNVPSGINIFETVK